MNANTLLSTLTALVLFSGLARAADPKPAPESPARPDMEALREELRNLPPEERMDRMRELREQYGLNGSNPGQRPMLERFRNQNPAMGGGAAGGAARIMMVLNPEQRESLRSATEADREHVRDLEEKLREARKAVAEASLTKDFNEDALRQKLEAAAKLDTELAIVRARALSRIKPPLSDEQIERIKNPPPMEEMMRDRPGFGGQPRPPGERPQPRGPRGEGNPPPREPF